MTTEATRLVDFQPAVILQLNGRRFIYDAARNRIVETDERGANFLQEHIDHTQVKALELAFTPVATEIIPRAIEFVMTGACNLQCTYCATRDRYLDAQGSYDRLDDTTALKALELLRPVMPEYVQVKFFGGEPLLCMPVIRRVVETLDSWGIESDKIIATNGLLLDDDAIDFLAGHRFLTLISLDGPQEVHDANRRDAGGRGSYERVVERLNRFRHRHPETFRTHVAVNMVVAPEFAGRFRELAGHLVNLGISSDQINPNDTAATSAESTYYTETQLRALRREKAVVRDEIVGGRRIARADVFGDCYQNYGGLRLPVEAGDEERPPADTAGVLLEDCQGHAWNIVTILPDGKVSACLEFKRQAAVEFGDVHAGCLDLSRLITFQKAFRASVIHGPCSRCWAVRMCSMTGCYKAFVANGCLPDWQKTEMCDLLREDLAGRMQGALQFRLQQERGGSA